MENRELWKAAATALLGLAVPATGGLRLIGTESPIFWPYVGVVVLLWLTGGAIFYRLKRHLFFGPYVGRDFEKRPQEAPLPPDESGLAGWRVYFDPRRHLPPILIVVCDGPISQAHATYSWGQRAHPCGAVVLRPNPNVLTIRVQRMQVNKGGMLKVEVRATQPIRVASCRAKRLRGFKPQDEYAVRG